MRETQCATIVPAAPPRLPALSHLPGSRIAYGRILPIPGRIRLREDAREGSSSFREDAPRNATGDCGRDGRDSGTLALPARSGFPGGCAGRKFDSNRILAGIPEYPCGSNQLEGNESCSDENETMMMYIMV